MSGDRFRVGMGVAVHVPDKPHLTGEGFILVGPVRHGDHDVGQVDMVDHDTWFPAD